MTLQEAERDIARILKELEGSNDCLVRDISIHGIDCTNIDDERRRVLRKVSIRLESLPAADWLQAP